MNFRLSATIALSLILARGSLSQDISVQELRQLAEPSWKRLNHLTQNVSITAINHSENSRIIYSRHGEDILVIESGHIQPIRQDDERRGIIASNPHYDFWIQEQRRNLWQLKVFEMGATSESETKRQLQARYFYIPHAWDHPGINCPLSETFENPKCTWKYARYMEFAGRRCVEAMLEETYQYRSASQVSKVSNVCVFDPDNSWTLLTATRTVPFKIKGIPITTECQLSYGKLSIDGIRFPETMVQTAKYSVNSKGITDTFDFLSISPCTAQPQEFYLSHYDLPEPRDVQPPRRPAQFYFIILVILLLAISSYVFHRLGQARRRTQLAPVDGGHA